jgi:hypothetical protein
VEIQTPPLYPTIGEQPGAEPTTPATLDYGYNYQRSRIGTAVENSSNGNSIFSFNGGTKTSTANTRNDDTWRANLASKRSRSPRGESSYQVP